MERNRLSAGRVALAAFWVLTSTFVLAQTTGTQKTGAEQQPAPTAPPGTQQAPAPGAQQPAAPAGQAAPNPAPGSQPAAQQPSGPHPPQAKTQEEFDAYKAVLQANAPDAVEKAADDFSVKYADSELRPVLYQRAMQLYWQQNNADKVIQLGRKILEMESTNPIALSMTATALAERTRDTDIDRNERLMEAQKDATDLVNTVDQSLQRVLPVNAQPEQVQSLKNQLLAMAYAAMGKAQLESKQDAKAEQSFQKALQYDPGDARSQFRLSLALDHQGRYADALAAANKAMQNGQNDPILPQVQRERDRLMQLTGANAGSTTSQPAAHQPPTR